MAFIGATRMASRIFTRELWGSTKLTHASGMGARKAQTTTGGEAFTAFTAFIAFIAFMAFIAFIAFAMI